ncbi:tetratricopeptide repeat protein [Pyxidicoccus parkwayensis]|uniref:Tetratricopeptide repeat protein n=1 Tax=Pyxidicoccus parkwayensis TaxID=2813578 RepID=A0ABX7P506_9BACT|nr:tetratricopeptide repeat protein [Pyxidicoccus parkwaysis]QSQ25565.1 tetratricopeptide repeat protein [Pyxidicoccus parkwaysis]
MGADLYREGLERLEAGDVEEGRRLLEAALRASPGDVAVMHGLARALDLAGERARAEELLELAHARAPDAPEPACDLAMFLLERGEEARAEQVLVPVLSALPSHPRANLHLALALAKTAPERARAHAAKARQGDEPEVREQAVALERVLASAASR